MLLTLCALILVAAIPAAVSVLSALAEWREARRWARAMSACRAWGDPHEDRAVVPLPRASEHDERLAA